MNTYFGIPYAKAPVGDLRFQRPVLPETGAIDAGLYEKECSRTIQDGEHQSEDCLYLDIWQPKEV